MSMMQPAGRPTPAAGPVHVASGDVAPDVVSTVGPLADEDLTAMCDAAPQQAYDTSGQAGVGMGQYG